VQANNTSDWFGMVHERGAQKPSITLVSGQPAYLEVRIDPAAHGESGIGPWQRGVAVSTASGQRLEFILTANVVR
jgi:hypothetical protein